MLGFTALVGEAMRRGGGAVLTNNPDDVRSLTDRYTSRGRHPDVQCGRPATSSIDVPVGQDLDSVM
jgi:hypothetical protein